LHSRELVLAFWFLKQPPHNQTFTDEFQDVSKAKLKNELLDLQIATEQGFISEEKFITLSDSIINRVDKSPVTDANAVALMIAYKQKMSDQNLKDQAIVKSRSDSLPQ